MSAADTCGKESLLVSSVAIVLVRVPLGFSCMQQKGPAKFGMLLSIVVPE
jgi:hypothetical protein